MEENGAFELVRCFTLVEASLTTSAESRPQIPFDHEEGAVRFGLFYHCFHDGLCLQELVPANLAIKHFNSIGTCVHSLPPTRACIAEQSKCLDRFLSRVHVALLLLGSCLRKQPADQFDEHGHRIIGEFLACLDYLRDNRGASATCVEI